MTQAKVVLGVLIGTLAFFPAMGQAAEHGGKEQKEHGGAATQEHGGKEHGGTQTQEHGGTTEQEHGGTTVHAEPSATDIRQAIRTYVEEIEGSEGAFVIDDEVTGATRTLSLVRVHDRVGKTGELYYSCTDMRDADTGEILDLDFDVEHAGEELGVVDVRIHKVNGKARYTYDQNDNRIPSM